MEPGHGHSIPAMGACVFLVGIAVESLFFVLIRVPHFGAVSIKFAKEALIMLMVFGAILAAIGVGNMLSGNFNYYAAKVVLDSRAGTVRVRFGSSMEEVPTGEIKGIAVIHWPDRASKGNLFYQVLYGVVLLRQTKPDIILYSDGLYKETLRFASMLHMHMPVNCIDLVTPREEFDVLRTRLGEVEDLRLSTTLNIAMAVILPALLVFTTIYFTLLGYLDILWVLLAFCAAIVAGLCLVKRITITYDRERRALRIETKRGIPGLIRIEDVAVDQIQHIWFSRRFDKIQKVPHPGRFLPDFNPLKGERVEIPIDQPFTMGKMALVLTDGRIFGVERPAVNIERLHNRLVPSSGSNTETEMGTTTYF